MARQKKIDGPLSSHMARVGQQIVDSAVKSARLRKAAPRDYRPQIGLIGCGGITEHHLQAYQAAGWEVVAFCDAHPPFVTDLAEGERLFALAKAADARFRHGLLPAGPGLACFQCVQPLRSA